MIAWRGRAEPSMGPRPSRAQLSLRIPGLSKQFRKLSSMVNVSKRRPRSNFSFALGAQFVQTAPPDLSKAQALVLRFPQHRFTPEAPQGPQGVKLFGVPALLFTRYKGKQVFDLLPGQAVADQGAEINIISRRLVLENKIPVYDLGSVGSEVSRRSTWSS